MSASSLTTEMTNQGIKIKEWLKSAGYEEDATHIDYYLCQYDYKNISDKLEMLISILFTFNSRRLSEMYIPDFITESIKVFCNTIERLKMKLEEEINTISVDRFVYNGKEYIFMRDTFNWILNEKCIVVLLKENGQYFNDNLVALDYSGKVIWSSLECIECKNRMGACFVGLNELSEEIICANAYVGRNYFLNAMTGEINEKNCKIELSFSLITDYGKGFLMITYVLIQRYIN